ncbi:unnamed protein product [Didymodactylos carnosus]|uniref:Uncharacterized protein n=1 Tax=Didymodactylos carnosus TaxID=1234261 RepID=A0A8S2EYF3_9BILA|nr:unnamed protein product [Didymodactylos carnosus]CAF4141485.1 unnamed protein product [Didymodactylos carnosus]
MKIKERPTLIKILSPLKSVLNSDSEYKLPEQDQLKTLNSILGRRNFLPAGNDKIDCTKQPSAMIYEMSNENYFPLKHYNLRTAGFKRKRQHSSGGEFISTSRNRSRFPQRFRSRFSARNRSYSASHSHRPSLCVLTATGLGYEAISNLMSSLCLPITTKRHFIE